MRVPWVRVSDDFTDHARFEGLSLAAIGLWISGLAWSNRNLKDGRIPAAKARTLHVEARPKVVKELVESGLWVELPGAYEIRDYLQYQKDAQTILAEREAARLRKAKSRVRQKDSPARYDDLPPDPMAWGA